MKVEEYKPKTKVQKYFKKLASMKYQDEPLIEEITDLGNRLAIVIRQFGLLVEMVYHEKEKKYRDEYIEINIEITTEISQYKTGFRAMDGEYAFNIDDKWTEINVYDFQEKVIKKLIEMGRYINEFFINLKNKNI